MNTDHNIKNTLQKRLHDYEVDLPKDDWKHIEDRLPKRSRRYTLICRSAAAIALLTIVTGSCWFFLSNQEGPHTLQLNADAIIEDSCEHTNSEMAQTSSVDANIEKEFSTDTPKTSQGSKTTDCKHSRQIIGEKNSKKTLIVEKSSIENTLSNIPDSIKDRNSQESLTATTNDANLPQEVKTLSIEEAEQLMAIQDRAFQQTLQGEDKERKELKKNNLNLGLLASVAPSAGGNSSISNNGVAAPVVSGGGVRPMASAIQTDNKHYLPLSFGLSVGIPLVNRLDLKTGITYTFIHSRFSTILSNSDIVVSSKDQYLHYIGIPIMLSYNIIEHRAFKFYASAGGAVEKGLLKQVKDYKPNNEGITIAPNNSQQEPISGLQYSLTASLGAAITIFKNLNFYIEPGFTWYIPNNAVQQPVSLRTENPYYISLTAGLRFNFNKT